MAASNKPALKDLAADVQRAVIQARAELDQVSRELGALRAEREVVLSAPLHHSDVEAELARHLAKQADEARQYLRGAITEMITKSPRMATVDPENCASYSPVVKEWAPELLALLHDPADAARKMVSAAGVLSVNGEGLPLDARRIRVAELDARIAALSDREAEITAGLLAAGVTVPSAAAVPLPPEIGEIREVNGRREQFGYVPGGGSNSTPGWLPV